MLTQLTLVNSLLLSLNPCLDDWLPQWVVSPWQVIGTEQHGQRLEAMVAMQPELVVSGSFVNRQLRLALQAHTDLHTLPYTQTYTDWQQAVQQLAARLGQSRQGQAWLNAQAAELSAFDLTALGEILVVMPNAYTWGQDSWIANLLTRQGGELSSLMGAGELVRLSIEELISSQPDTVILEGFSADYARAHDWLWHDAVQDWLAQRRHFNVDGAVAGCSDVRAVEYLQALDPVPEVRQ
ncbi:ABC transporter substrate-binding protein [Pseudidiomarina insulisalsae]|uniref:Fe/B12 periplasmic-binding domain-containing protein n=1 Tax=Pseudidiomarina insulisalsae TaxID=575789 RepID=A0A432Y8Z6_9GAMM|nr:ABC transporter substrate-binding protein [Pseudidiomarina insulisalsae]RUO57326.1 hypothetical protein CWI71_11770 [Pseudidiomarina insulisalsae]